MHVFSSSNNNNNNENGGGGVRSVSAAVVGRNEAAERLLEKLGMRECGGLGYLPSYFGVLKDCNHNKDGEGGEVTYWMITREEFVDLWVAD
ncbi:hypothetical protein HK102_005966, partial [Quaeritorhiza haematococci]